MNTDIFHDYEDAYQPTLEELITEAINECEPEEVAELIALSIEEMQRAIQAFREHKDDPDKLYTTVLRRISSAKACLTDIYAWDNDDPRQNGWVDDRGRP